MPRIVRASGIVAGVVLLAGILWALAGPRLFQPNPETLAIRAVAEGAIRSLYFDAFPPASYRDGPLPSPVAQSIRDRVSAHIANSFTPSPRARYEPMILAAVDQIGTGSWDSAGDLTIDWGSATITGDRSTIGFRSHQWLIRHSADPGQPSQAPWRLEGSWDWQLTLVRTDDRWQVDALDSQCVAGCP